MRQMFIALLQIFLDDHPRIADELEIDDEECACPEVPEIPPEAQRLIVWFDGGTHVIETTPGSQRVHFGSWTLLNPDRTELTVREWTFQLLVNEDPDGNNGWPNLHPSLVPTYVDHCILVNDATGVVLASDVMPDTDDGTLVFEDWFTVDGVPLKVNLECDLTGALPADDIGLMANENVGVSVLDNWTVEDINGDTAIVDTRGLNRDDHISPLLWVRLNSN